MILGFTGTRKLTIEQFTALKQFLRELHRDPIEKVVHGDCVGADSLFDQLVCGHTPWVRELFPSDVPGLRANSHLYSPERIVRVHPPAPPLVRNAAVVRESDYMIACPSGRVEELRSGTWATIRLARKHGKHPRIFWPDGEQFSGGPPYPPY